MINISFYGATSGLLCTELAALCGPELLETGPTLCEQRILALKFMQLWSPFFYLLSKNSTIGSVKKMNNL